MPSDSPVQQRPNILFVVMDSVRAANVSCFGYERATTPNLDALAQQGVLFEQAISVGCWTLPVHATIFTGLYPASHGLTVSKDALPDGFPTLARRLRELGYSTACFSNNPYVSDASGLTQGFDTVEDLWRLTRPRGTARPRGSELGRRLRRRGPLGRAAFRATRVIARARSTGKRWKEWRSESDSGADATNERLRSWLAGASGSDSPFFAFVNYMESHERYNPPYPYNRRFLPGRLARWRAARLRTKAEILAATEAEREGSLETLRALYDGALAYLDERIGELVSSLEALGLLEDTVLIVTSDHGDSLGEHGHIGHRLFLYEQLVHVPLVIRYPARFVPGTRVRGQVQLGDLYPTVLDLAGDLSAAESSSGFASLLAAPETAVHPYAIAENTAPKSLDGMRMRMVRGDRFKYIWKSNGEQELYDLAEDPGETVDLTASRPDVVGAMATRLDGWERSLADTQIETREAAYDEETLQRLRGLGYIG